MLNAIKYTEELERAGFSRDQAETSVRILVDVMNENFATKSDLKELGAELRSEIKEVRHELREMQIRVDSSFKELEYKLTIKLGAMLTIAIGAMATLNHLSR